MPCGRAVRRQPLLPQPAGAVNAKKMRRAPRRKGSAPRLRPVPALSRRRIHWYTFAPLPIPPVRGPPVAVRLRLIVLSLALGTAAGCGEPPAVQIALVHGLVTFRGTPLSSGLVVFTPDDDYGSGGQCATGRIERDGRFTLTTDRAPGAAVGKYRVTVAGPDGWLLPDKFLDPHLSGLRAEVVAAHDNQFDFKLEEK